MPGMQTEKDIEASKKAHEAIGPYYECVVHSAVPHRRAVSLVTRPPAGRS